MKLYLPASIEKLANLDSPILWLPCLLFLCIFGVIIFRLYRSKRLLKELREANEALEAENTSQRLLREAEINGAAGDKLHDKGNYEAALVHYEQSLAAARASGSAE
ncbi:MAG: hypothetical protein K2X27_25625, partial [Candidatus Obscuribacterales bacterium]|nr:hypothetical protein [Candidatus Obscuribacterales bacterium]